MFENEIRQSMERIGADLGLSVAWAPSGPDGEVARWCEIDLTGRGCVPTEAAHDALVQLDGRGLLPAAARDLLHLAPTEDLEITKANAAAAIIMLCHWEFCSEVSLSGVQPMVRQAMAKLRS